MTNLILLKNVVILPELFLGLSIVYILLYGSIVSTHKTYPLIQNSILKLSVLILFFCIFLLYNDLPFLSNESTLFFNDTIVTDYLSLCSKLLIAFFSLLCLIVIRFYLKDQKINQFEYSIIILIAILGFFLLCSANDLITAYLAIELQSLAFYVMSAFKKNSSFSVEAGLKYFVLGSFSSALLLLGFSIIYGMLGTLNFEDFKTIFNMQDAGLTHIEFVRSTDLELNTMFDACFDPTLLQLALVLVLVSLFFKLAVAPLHVWSPDVYENSPSSSTVFFAVVSKIGVLVLLIRLFHHTFHGFIYTWRYYVVVLAVLSVIAGSFTALEQRKLKSLLAYSSISHIGYILIAFSSGNLVSLQSLYAYIIVYMLAGVCIWSIFLSLRLKTFYFKKQNKDLTDFVLLVKSNNTLAICFSLVLLSIAGFPPLIGFITKMGIFMSAIESTMYFIAVISILTSVVSTFYYIRIIKIIYFEKVLVGNLFYPLQYMESFIIVITFFSSIFLFINPTLLYLVSYKMSLLGYI